MSKTPDLFTLGSTGSTVLDPSFPRVAAKAALEVDSALLRLQGKRAPAEFQADGVAQLLPFIKLIVRIATESNSPKDLATKVDPASANVFFVAYGQIDRKAGKGQTGIQEKFAKAAERVAGILERVIQKDARQLHGLSTNDLVYTRDFCRALSDTAAVRQYVPHAAIQGLRRFV